MSYATRQAVVLAIRAMAAAESMHVIVRNLTPAQQKESGANIYEADNLLEEAAANLDNALAQFERSIGHE